MAEKRRTGRPSTYDPAIAARICQHIAEGKSVNSIQGKDGIPAFCTIYEWIGKYPDFAEMYTRAREDQADTMADQIVQIADDATNDTIKDEKGNDRPNSEWINRSRLRVDARKWVAAKLKPRKYGDKVTTELVGKDGGPVQVNNTQTFDVLLSQVEARVRASGKE